MNPMITPVTRSPHRRSDHCQGRAAREVGAHLGQQTGVVTKKFSNEAPGPGTASDCKHRCLAAVKRRLSENIPQNPYFAKIYVNTYFANYGQNSQNQ